MSEAKAIALYQPVLIQIALKIVGSLADAEDIVQDTFLKWLTANREKIENTKAYLVKSVVNNSLNHINNIKRKKTEALQNLNSSDLADWYKEKEFFKFDMEVELKAAMEVVHKKLEPIERGIFVLRELFDFEYEELQHIFDKKKDNCRKLFSRAKKKLSESSTSKDITGEKEKSFFDSLSLNVNLSSPSEYINQIKAELQQKLQGKKS